MHEFPLIEHYGNWKELQEDDPVKFKKWLPDGTHPIPEGSLAVTWPTIQAFLEKARAAAKGNPAIRQLSDEQLL